jgi:hypothetical protein
MQRVCAGAHVQPHSKSKTCSAATSRRQDPLPNTYHIEQL